MSVEVDFQVLINITGYVSTDDEKSDYLAYQEQQIGGGATSLLASSSSQSPSLASIGSQQQQIATTGSEQGSSNKDNQSASDSRAEQPAASVAGGEDQSAAQMQSDQATSSSDQINGSSSSAGGGPAQTASQNHSKMRLVSHTLVLNRKKICTVHPVPVPVQPPITRRPILTNQGFLPTTTTTTGSPTLTSGPSSQQIWPANNSPPTSVSRADK